MERDIRVVREFLDSNNIGVVHNLSADVLINIFYSAEQDVFYSLLTDGEIEHIDDWIDKKPFFRDTDLYGISTVKRSEYKVNDAGILVVEKKIRDRFTRDLYVNDIFFDEPCNRFTMVPNCSLSYNDKERLIVKRLENFRWR